MFEVLEQHSKLNKVSTNSLGSHRRQRGVTLVEMAMVIGIISLVILGSLLALESVTEQRRMTQAVQDIAMIRSAVSKFAAGGLVVYPGSGTGDTAISDTRNLADWGDLAGFLPGSLGIQTSGSTSATVSTGNPWSEDYVLSVPAAVGSGTAGSAKWTLTLNGVPTDLAPILVKQLDLNGALESTYDGGTGACDPVQSGGASVAGESVWVCVSYEE